MVGDYQVRKLKKILSNGETLRDSALKAGIDEKTARKYRKTDEMPSELKAEHTWRTRGDPFEDVWEEVRQMLHIAPSVGSAGDSYDKPMAGSIIGLDKTEVIP